MAGALAMMSVELSLREFAIAWLPMLGVAATSTPPAPQLGEAFLVQIAGVHVPVVTCILGTLGIVLGRPFARRSEAQLSWPMFLLVSAIMLITVQLWIVETRPSWLFAFVVAIGMGFSGYSLIELFGEQLHAFAREIIDKARATIGGKSASNGIDTDHTGGRP